MTPGSLWVFFRAGDDALRDPWAARTIRIVRATRDKRGRMQLEAECIQLKTIHNNARKVPARRRVKYSELW